MGCYLSTNQSSSPPHKTTKTEASNISKSPPQQDEYVKQVLSLQQNYKNEESAFLRTAPLSPSLRGTAERKRHRNDTVLEELDSDENSSDRNEEFYEFRRRFPAISETRLFFGEGKLLGRVRPGCGSGRDVGETSDSSSMKTGQATGSIGCGSGERIRNVEEGEESGDSNEWPPTAGDETLENPLVSLECFIFL
ncbi:hypothetical protein BUALT_Bualt18G0110200 [Buddleja alternifolia]|uniref:Uncharacterized protein n=1 Tax=Buddleja alternifolia TaxID=168488 RepID=A0AAV6WEP0_9LAMI|nr:hypothetical protein BUALT_Bualt18G0110200 [Buddleja alternifolia]